MGDVIGTLILPESTILVEIPMFRIQQSAPVGDVVHTQKFSPADGEVLSLEVTKE